MPDLTRLVFLPGSAAFLLGYLITPLVIKLAWRLGIIDDPKKHKHPKVIHEKPTPRGGGLAIYIAILVAVLVFLPLDKHMIGILTGATILLLVGLADDWLLSRGKELNPYLRLGVQFLAAGAPVAAGIGIAFISNPFDGIIDLSHPQIHFFFLGEERSIWILSDLFAFLWIVYLMNAVNVGAKGVDGQLSGVVAIAAATIAALSLKFSADITQWPVIALASIVAGSYLGFLPWHIYPQKIMPSFAGSNLAAYLLAVLSILSTTKVGTLAVVLAVPLIDTGYVIVRRILSGKSPVWGDRGHLHHRLLDAGWSITSVAAFYWLITAILGILALSLNAASKFYTMVGVAAFVGGLILWLTYRPKSKA